MIGLVSEARPIPLERLAERERKLIERAESWISAVVEDAARTKSGPDEIDENRSGRVLFIDGPRGAGKTSLLLTLLKFWGARTSSEQGNALSGKNNKHLQIFLPVLDFDPLPRGMPLHGWLLEPWRSEAGKLDNDAGAGGFSSADLTEQLSELFERTVTGWTPTDAAGKGVIEKAIAYQEQASGWLETSALWYKFVNAMVCRKSNCRKDKCAHGHKHVFIVPIDDVDLQVEQIPQLLHAIRLLHHPNVAYVLTGDHAHLKFVLRLDYIGRHTTRSRAHPDLDKRHADEIDDASTKLAGALLEKAIPSHALLVLKHLNLDDVVNIAAGNNKPLKDSLSQWWDTIPLLARSLPVVTARQAQHAVDRYLDECRAVDPPLDPPWNPSSLVADVCKTELSFDKTTSTYKFAIQGRLSTQAGARLRVLKGGRVNLVLSAQPVFLFGQSFGEAGEAAHGALFIQLLTELPNLRVVAHSLDWVPDAGILASEVTWTRELDGTESVAVFHWPWLLRPSAHQILTLEALSKTFLEIVSGPTGGNSLSDLPESLLARWLDENMKWYRERTPPNSGLEPTVASSPNPANGGASNETPAEAAKPSIQAFLSDLAALRSGRRDEEIERWIRELFVMTAPYFGLNPDLAERLREGLLVLGPVDADEIVKMQKRLARTAITARGDDPGEKVLEESADEFLRQRKEREAVRRATEEGQSIVNKWWSWLESISKA